MTRLVSRKLTFLNKATRGLWTLVYSVLFRFSPVPFHGWRALLLRVFGAKIGKNVRIYPSARIWAPWNLAMSDFSCLGPDVDCYCVASIFLGKNAVVSQRSFLCSASHDFESYHNELVVAPISLEENVWITAEVYVGPGVTVRTGAVVLARSVVVRDVEAWTVVAGNPAKFIKNRIMCRVGV